MDVKDSKNSYNLVNEYVMGVTIILKCIKITKRSLSASYVGNFMDQK